MRIIRPASAKTRAARSSEASVAVSNGSSPSIRSRPSRRDLNAPEFALADEGRAAVHDPEIVLEQLSFGYQ